MYSARKSRSPSTFGVSRDEPEKSAHNVIGSGFHRGRIGTSLLRLSGCFAIHSGRTVMPRPSKANGRLMPGSLVTTWNAMFGLTSFDPRDSFQAPEPAHRWAVSSSGLAGLPTAFTYAGLAKSPLAVPG